MAIRLASITINSGATAVTVNSPSIDLTTLVQNGYELMVDGLSLPLTIISGGNNSLEIAPEDAPSTTLTARAAKIIQTKGPLKEALTGLESARQVLVDFKDSVSAAADADSIGKRDSSGRFSVAAPANDNHAVNKGFLGSAAQRDVGTSAGNLMAVPAFGLGGGTTQNIIDAEEMRVTGIFGGGSDPSVNFPTPFSRYAPFLSMRRSSNIQSSLHIYGFDGVVDAALMGTADGGQTWGKASLYHSANLDFLQNTSGGSVASNSTVSGANLTPPKSGTWRNISGGAIANNDYGLWEIV